MVLGLRYMCHRQTHSFFPPESVLLRQKLDDTALSSPRPRNSEGAPSAALSVSSDAAWLMFSHLKESYGLKSMGHSAPSRCLMRWDDLIESWGR